MNLKKNETIIKEIAHTNEIPFRLEDLLTIPFFIFFAFVFVIVFSFNDHMNRDLLNYFLIPLAIIFSIFMTIGRIFIRWYKTKTSRFFITNERIIFSDELGKLVEKSFNIGIELSYRENLYGNGYITIGKPASLFRRRGINLVEDTDVMYNVLGVKEIFDEIKNIQDNVA